MSLLYRLLRRDFGTFEHDHTVLHDEYSFFSAFSADVKRATQKVNIESPFITVHRSKEFAAIAEKAIRRGIKITVYTRIPAHHDDALRDQAIDGIRLLKAAGIKVIEQTDYSHRKIAMIDERVLWEGSMNMLSHSNSPEVMRRTESRKACSDMRRFIKHKTAMSW